MSDLRSSLLGDSKKKLDTFQKMYDDCVHRIKRIKQKNDTLQKNAGTDLEDEIAVEVQKQKEYIEEEIKELKEQMDLIENKYRDPEAKNKMKEIKKQAQKEIQRNKSVLRDFINKSFLNVKNTKRSRASNGSDDQGKYFEGGKNSLMDDDAPRNPYQNNGYQNNGYHNENNYDNNNRGNDYEPYNFNKNKQHQQSQIDIDYDLENRLQDEKIELLKNVEKDAQKILNIVTEGAEIVNEADEMLDHITDNVVNTNRNVLAANEKMEEADGYQRKAKKKYIIFALIILLVVALVTGVILIVKLK